MPDCMEWRRSVQAKCKDAQLFNDLAEKTGVTQKELASAPVSSVNAWLADTGCGHDLVSEKDVKAMAKSIRRAKEPIVFSTANGAVPSYWYIAMKMPELNEVVNPRVLQDAPSVLSVGQRCMDMGYTFVWPSGSAPYFVLPTGEFLYLEVQENIPYL